MQKIPYLVIIGKKEEKAKKIAIRQRKFGDLGQMSIEEFEAKMRKEM